ncbi:MAG: phosphatase PAP2 family protein [Polyangiaceae bacterium]
MMKGRLVTEYRRCGLLVWLSVGSLLLAALLHHLSRLPSAYTWFEPLRTLRRVAALRGFPLAVIAVYALGAWDWRGAWNIERSAHNLARTLPTREVLQRSLRPLLSIAAVVMVDAFVLGSERDAVDLISLVAIGFVLAAHRPSRPELVREAGYGLLSSAVFLAICYCYTVLKALTFSHGRALDASILEVEGTLFGAPPHRALARWTAAHLDVAQMLDWVYFHFFEHMALTTVLLVALRRGAQRTEYLGALALCYLLGGPLYQLIPALGPSYFEPHYFEFLSDPRLMTGMVRSYLQHNTDAVLAGTAERVRTWGYIACMPSLHVAQELVMLYYSRSCRLAFALSLAFTLLTLVAVVALGWHYPLDSLGGAIVALAAIAIARSQSGALMPLSFGRNPDLKPPPAKAVIVPFVRAYLAARRQREAADP